MKYNAFISYSHRQDDDLGANLEKTLEKFAKPTFKRRALDIFRDSNDLSAAADLGQKIRTGIDESEYFIFMASPASAQSKWCQREVEYWREHKSMDNFLIALTDGEIFYDESTSDFDWERTTALPKNLSGAFAGEPLYTDFRNVGATETQNLKNRDFEGKIVHIAATLHKKSVGDMVGEAVRQQRRTIRLRNAAISVLSILLLIAIGLSIYATRQKNKALLSTYIANSQAQFSIDPTKSLRLAEYAYNFAEKKDMPTKDASEQLIKVFYSGFGFYVENPNLEFDFQKKEKYSDQNNEYYVWYKEIAERINQSIPIGDYLAKKEDFYFNPSTNQAIYLIAGTAMPFPRLYFLSQDEFSNEAKIDSVDIKLEGFSGYTAYITDLEISSDGKYSILGSANSKSALIENEAYHHYNANKDIFKDRTIFNTSKDYDISNVAFNSDQNYIATLSHGVDNSEKRRYIDSTFYYWKKEAFPYIEIKNTDNEYGNLSVDQLYYFKLDEEMMDLFSWFHYKQTIYDFNHKPIIEFPNAKGADLTLTTSSDGRFSINYQGIFNAENELLIRLDIDMIDNPGIAYCFSTDNNFVKVSYLDGPERIFALDPQFIISRIYNLKVMGAIAQLNSKDKKRFLIDD
ncbi:TIR domain-containing protein [Flavobacteriaceae bacterium MAR_2010_188]|nr:TIR domain-containing protein [Flavobacteriaceae bacterium MAR_2010_188]